MTTLLTGASGFVGAALLQRLRGDDRNVMALVRAPTTRLAGMVPTVCVGGFSGVTNFGSALSGITTVVHLAARVHVMSEKAENPLEEFRKVNVAGTEHLARFAAASGVKRFVYVSSIGVNGVQTASGRSFSETDKPNPHNAYALSKWEAEQSLLRVSEETGLEVVILRPPLVYGRGAPGNFAALMRAVQRGWPLPLGAVHNRRSLVALDNLVDFIVTCMFHPKAANQTFLVSDGRDLSTPELVRGLADAAGVPARLVPVPVWALRAGTALLGKGDAMQRLCGNLQVDISKARSLLDWVPPISVDEGLCRVVAGVQKP